MPACDANLGDQAVQFAAKAGLFLDPWQQDVLRGSLGVIRGGKWAAQDVTLLVPRQNGKNAVLEARELFGLFVLGEQLIVHSAHKFDTAQEHFQRLRILIDGSPELQKHVAAIPTANGKEAIILRNGCRLKFKARTKSGGGRGFSADLVVLDEAMHLPDEMLDSISASVIAKRNPQTWFTSSAGMPDSDALWRLVERGRAHDPEMAYFEWGCPTGVNAHDRESWANANPGLGHRLSVRALEGQLKKLSPEGFAREHLGVWDDLAENAMVKHWGALRDTVSQPDGPPTYALEVSEDRKWACVAAAAAGYRGLYVDIGAYRGGTGWVVDFLADLAARRRAKVVVQPSSPAGSLISELEARRVTVEKVSVEDYRAACGQFFDSVTDSADLRHPGNQALDISVREATMKPSGDAWVWDRRNPNTDISPLAAVTLAAWGARQKPARSGRFLAL